MSAAALGFVAAEVAKGFLNEAGKQIFKKMFSSSGDEHGHNFQRLFSEAFETFSTEIKLHIDSAFYRERFHKAEMSLKEMIALFNLYIFSNPSSRDLLDECVVKGSNAVVQLQDIGYPAIQQYGAAVTLLIAIFEERAAVISSDQLKPISKEIVPRGISNLKEMKAELELLSRKRVRLGSKVFYNIPGNGEIAGVLLVVRKDGEVVERQYFPDESEDYGKFHSLVEKHQADVLQEVKKNLRWADDLIEAWSTKYPQIPK